MNAAQRRALLESYPKEVLMVYIERYSCFGFKPEELRTIYIQVQSATLLRQMNSATELLHRICHEPVGPTVNDQLKHRAAFLRQDNVVAGLHRRLDALQRTEDAIVLPRSG